VDIQPLFFRLTLDSASEFLFSESVNCQLQTESSTLGTEEEIALASAVDQVQFTTAKGIRLGDKYWVAFNKRFYQKVGIIHSFVDRFVQQALSSDEKTDENPASYLHSIIKETRDPAELRSEIMTLLFGGRDTTASALSWFFFTMAKHPKVYQHLRDTVLDEFGSYSNPKTITYESMKACRYLQWCINETLRLHTIAPVISRAASRDTTLPVGGGPDGTSPVYLKKGHPVSLAVCIRPFWLLCPLRQLP
jgi:cytochrome P450